MWVCPRVCRLATLTRVSQDLERELHEAGLSDEAASQLAELATEIEALPEIDPRAAWRRGARRRLLDHLAETQVPEADSAPDDSPR